MVVGEESSFLGTIQYLFEKVRHTVLLMTGKKIMKFGDCRCIGFGNKGVERWRPHTKVNFEDWKNE